MKQCSRCGKILENQNTKRGSYCRSCRNEYNKIHNKTKPDIRRKANANNRRKIRQRIVEEKSKACTDCGNHYPWYVMDFDHVRGEKKIVLSLAANKHLSFDRITEEIAKCDLVCANCHRIRTFTRTVRSTD